MAWSCLEDLWADGKVVETGAGRWDLPYNELCGMEPENLKSLGLPEPENLQVKVETRGVPGHPGLGIAMEVRHPSLGNLEAVVERRGPVYFPVAEQPILANGPVYELLCMASDGPKANGIEDHFKFLACAQALGRKAGARLDGFLETEEYHFSTRVDVAVDEHDAENFELRAAFNPDEVPEDVSSDFLNSDTPPRIQNSRDRTGRRRRVVISPDAREQVQRLRQHRSIQGSQVPRFVENPQAFLPIDIDLEQFSKRVRGLRTVVYNSRPYLHIRQSEEGWFEGIPGVRLESIQVKTTEDDNGQESGSKEPELSPETYRNLAKKAKQSGDEYVRHGDGWLRIDPSAANNFVKILDQYGDGNSKTFRIPQRAVLEIYENLEALEFELPPIESLGLHRNLIEFPDPPIPASFTGELLPHQNTGYRWLAFLLEKQTGGLLADDMGLGKTVQVIVHMARLAEEGRLKPSLVVCPKTIIENWQRELRRFLPGQKLSIVGSGLISAQTLSKQDLVLMSYDSLRCNQLEAGKVDWQLVVCDEAQYAKNPTAQRTTAVKALKCSHRVALTGTPVENGMIEFWCIMDFVRPGLLGCWNEFRSTYERPLVEAQEEEQRRPLVDNLLERIGRHYFRRMKDEILPDLPPLTAQTIESNLSERQFELYRHIAHEARTGGRGAALAAITRLLMLCAHPHAISGDPASFRYVQGECPKLDATVDILQGVRIKNQKAIIFTRFLKIQRILQAAIRECFGIWPDVLNGEILRNRQMIVDKFSDHPGFGVLILSHDVGGIGLNITEANHVIHYTRPWNPAKENQGTDRSHRIGQKLPVTVYYPLVSDNRFDTVEKRLNRLLEGKKSLARDVLRPTRDSAVSADELLTCLDDVPEEPQ
ncbi:MAG: DEAD/DEAH box helicase [Acidobacteria bacterium]|nr:DEAD/DEAH box helicase [Acidobacteriota bacterium]